MTEHVENPPAGPVEKPGSAADEHWRGYPGEEEGDEPGGYAVVDRGRYLLLAILFLVAVTVVAFILMSRGEVFVMGRSTSL
jgi:hypothetical protein